MKRSAPTPPVRRARPPVAAATADAAALRWAKRLAAEVATVMAAHPDAEPENVRLTLISLNALPLERLNRSLRRGRGFAAFRR